jgi:hypothetical protein
MQASLSTSPNRFWLGRNGIRLAASFLSGSGSNEGILGGADRKWLAHRERERYPTLVTDNRRGGRVHGERCRSNRIAFADDGTN